jgi:EAL domain-containing protein (putative c-di-GMP-specific phosphodiesterase class I)
MANGTYRRSSHNRLKYVTLDASHEFDVSFAFQPIVDIASHQVFAYEALVRGRSNESAGSVFASLDAARLHVFDRVARQQAIALAATLGLDTNLSLNFLPQSLDTLPDAIDSTLDAARSAGISERQILLEVTEGELIRDQLNFARTLNRYRATGLRLVIDDFGAGYSGLNLLADFQPDVIKLDMHLVRDIDSKGPRQAIVRALIQVCDDLGIEFIAEGVETEAEYRWFKRVGVTLFQGYLFGRPVFEALPEPAFVG